MFILLAWVQTGRRKDRHRRASVAQWDGMWGIPDRLRRRSSEEIVALTTAFAFESPKALTNMAASAQWEEISMTRRAQSTIHDD
jgi:hypothetical protein